MTVSIFVAPVREDHGCRCSDWPWVAPSASVRSGEGILMVRREAAPICRSMVAACRLGSASE